MSLKNLESMLDSLGDKFGPKLVKYAGYSMEAGGFCGIVYGILAGDNWTTASSGALAYFGTLFHRSSKYIEEQNKDKGGIKNGRNL